MLGAIGTMVFYDSKVWWFKSFIHDQILYMAGMSLLERMTIF